MGRWRRCLLGLLLLPVVALPSAPAPSLAEELAIVVNFNASFDHLSRQDLINIFMGRYQQFPDGQAAIPLDLTGDSETFYRKLINKTPAELRSYWARLVFSGRGTPPRKLEAADQLLEVIANNPGAVGYLSASQVDDRVKIVHLLGD